MTATVFLDTNVFVLVVAERRGGSWTGTPYSWWDALAAAALLRC